MTIRDKIREEYYGIKEDLGHVPSRVEFFNNMDDDIYDNIKTKKGLSPFANYMEFLNNINELNEEESVLYNTRAREFINMIETTSMSKTYKMPVLLAFYNNGNIKMDIDEDDVYKSFYEFYHQGSNKVDMLKDKSTKDFMEWDSKKYIRLAKSNPVKYLLQTHSDFFKEKEGYVLALTDDLREFINKEEFKKHMKDAIDIRVQSYYRNRFVKNK